MTKHKKLTEKDILVRTGYALFGALIFAAIINTVLPLGGVLLQPKAMHFNVAVMLVAFTAGLLLPFLVAYGIGERAVTSKSRVQHHFNGMLFALVGYWCMLAIPVHLVIAPFMPEGAELPVSARIIMSNLLPVIGVSVVTAVLAFMHVRSKGAKKDVVEYLPYQIVLLAAIGLPLIFGAVQSVMTQWWYGAISAGVVVIVGGVLYGVLGSKKMTTMTRVTWSAVFVSVLFIIAFIASQLITGVQYVWPGGEVQSVYNALNVASAVVAFVLWAAFVRSTMRRLKGKR